MRRRLQAIYTPVAAFFQYVLWFSNSFYTVNPFFLKFPEKEPLCLPVHTLQQLTVCQPVEEMRRKLCSKQQRSIKMFNKSLQWKLLVLRSRQQLSSVQVWIVFIILITSHLFHLQYSSHTSSHQLLWCFWFSCLLNRSISFVCILSDLVSVLWSMSLPDPDVDYLRAQLLGK